VVVSFQFQYDADDLKVKILTSGKERKVISESASSSIDESKKFVITFASTIQQEIIRNHKHNTESTVKNVFYPFNTMLIFVSLSYLSFLNCVITACQC
jgi:hypothetical protein